MFLGIDSGNAHFIACVAGVAPFSCTCLVRLSVLADTARLSPELPAPRWAAGNLQSVGYLLEDRMFRAAVGSLPGRALPALAAAFLWKNDKERERAGKTPKSWRVSDQEIGKGRSTHSSFPFHIAEPRFNSLAMHYSSTRRCNVL